MKIALAPGETLLREGAANLQRGIETVGGRLFLTDARLVFIAHAFNVQAGITDIPLASIHGVRPCWTHFLGLIPLAPNSLAVHAAAAEYRFVLSNRSWWGQAIMAAKAGRACC